MMLCSGCSGADLVAELIFFLYKVGDSMLEPSVRLLIYQSVCRNHYQHHGLSPHLDHSLTPQEDADGSSCSHTLSLLSPGSEKEVQSESAAYLIYYKLLVNLPAVLLGLFCGAWSDRVGRKLPVLLCCVGTVLAVICYMGSLALGSQGLALPLILTGAAIRGVFGKSAVITMALHSYVADMSTRETRTRKLGKLLAMNYFGYFVGSLAAGSLLQVAGYDVVFCAVMLVTALCILITMALMKDSVPEPPGEVEVMEDTGGTGRRPPLHPAHVKESLQVLYVARKGRARCHLLIMMLLCVIHQACKAGEVDVTLLFVERAPLNWPRHLYGYLLALDYACLGMAVFFLMPFLLWLLKLHDFTLVMLGLLFKIVRLVLLGLSTSSTTVYLSVVLGCPSAVVISGLKSAVSKSVAEHEVGKVFSLLSCGETAGTLVGAVAFTGLYACTESLYPGMVYLLDACLQILLLLGVALLAYDMRLTSHYHLLQGLSQTVVNKPPGFKQLFGKLDDLPEMSESDSED